MNEAAKIGERWPNEASTWLAEARRKPKRGRNLLIFRLRPGQGEAEGAPYAFATLKPNLATVHLDHRFGNGQAKTAAPGPPGDGVINAEELGEYLGLVWLRDADT